MVEISDINWQNIVEEMHEKGFAIVPKLESSPVHNNECGKFIPLLIKSDDITGRDSAFESIVREKPVVTPNLPNSFIVLANELTALGIKVVAKVIEANDKTDNGLATLSVEEGKL